MQLLYYFKESVKFCKYCLQAVMGVIGPSDLFRVGVDTLNINLTNSGDDERVVSVGFSSSNLITSGGYDQAIDSEDSSLTAIHEPVSTNGVHVGNEEPSLAVNVNDKGFENLSVGSVRISDINEDRGIRGINSIWSSSDVTGATLFLANWANFRLFPIF